MIYACKSNIALHICNRISLSRNIALFYRMSNVNSDKKNAETQKMGADNKITAKRLNIRLVAIEPNKNG